MTETVCEYGQRNRKLLLVTLVWGRTEVTDKPTRSSERDKTRQHMRKIPAKEKDSHGGKERSRSPRPRSKLVVESREWPGRVWFRFNKRSQGKGRRRDVANQRNADLHRIIDVPVSGLLSHPGRMRAKP